MNLPTIDEVYRYMNTLAEAYSLLQNLGDDAAILYAATDFESIKTNFAKELDAAWDKRRDTADFLATIENKFGVIQRLIGNERCIKAYTLCCWLDERITYLNIDEDELINKFSLYNLIPFDGTDKIITISALNTNYKTTKVQISPKFSVYKKLVLQEEKRKNPFANRDSFSFLNGQTQNVSFLFWRQNEKIYNLIIPPERLQNIDDKFTVAFCPLTDKNSILKLETKPIEISGIQVNGIEVVGVTCPEIIIERFKSDWQTAAEAGADLVMFPEMLGTKDLEEKDKHERYNKVVHSLVYDLRKQGGRPPVLTIMPSFWEKGKNSAAIVDYNGRILARQYKYEPYIDQGGHKVESLSEPLEKDYYIIHVPGVHRIVILICAEFLSICRHSNHILFEEAGSTMVLVPSYSHGEIDFVRLLPSLKCYGATIIWGNSCGETQEDRIIGGCSIAGTDTVYRFNKASLCGGHCKGKNACVFLVKLPLELSENRELPLNVDFVEHVIK